MASSQNRYSAHILVKTVFGPRVSQQQSYGEVVYVLGISSQSHDLQTHTYIVRLRPGPCADLVRERTHLLAWLMHDVSCAQIKHS